MFRFARWILEMLSMFSYASKNLPRLYIDCLPRLQRKDRNWFYAQAIFAPLKSYRINLFITICFLFSASEQESLQLLCSDFTLF